VQRGFRFTQLVVTAAAGLGECCRQLGQRGARPRNLSESSLRIACEYCTLRVE
jgi:hypothetical protein